MFGRLLNWFAYVRYAQKTWKAPSHERAPLVSLCISCFRRDAPLGSVYSVSQSVQLQPLVKTMGSVANGPTQRQSTNGPTGACGWCAAAAARLPSSRKVARSQGHKVASGQLALLGRK